MANRNYNRHQCLEKEIKTLYVDVAIGTSGAPTVSKTLGVSSVERNAAGDYTITLDDKYTRLMHVDATVVSSTEEDITVQVKAEAVSASKTIDIYTLTAGTATDPSDGDRILVKIDLKNSSVGE